MTEAPLTAVPDTLLAVWDVNGGFHDWPHRREAYEWAKAHGLDPENAIRIEFYLIDAPFARADRYKTGAGGLHCFAGGEPVTEEVTVMLSEPPPQHLRCFQ